MFPYKGHDGSEVNYFMPSQFDIDTLSNNYTGPIFSIFNNSFVKVDHIIEMDTKALNIYLEEDKDFYVNETIFNQKILYKRCIRFIYNIYLLLNKKEKKI